MLMSEYWREKVRRNYDRDVETMEHLKSRRIPYLVIWDDDPVYELLREGLERLRRPPAASSVAARSSRRRMARRRL